MRDFNRVKPWVDEPMGVREYLLAFAGGFVLFVVMWVLMVVVLA